MSNKKEGCVNKEQDLVRLKFYRALVIGLWLAVLGGAMSVPFVYETQTLWYKIGGDKIMLRAGQLIGLLAAVLIFTQILLASRGKFLRDVFGLATLMRLHRVNGIIVACLVVSHVALILIPEGLTNLPIGLKHWPEMVGSLLLWIILAMAISSHFRERLALNYKKWRVIHKILGYIAIVLLTIHVLFVSQSFHSLVPRVAFLSILAAVVIAVFLSKKPA